MTAMHRVGSKKSRTRPDDPAVWSQREGGGRGHSSRDVAWWKMAGKEAEYLEDIIIYKWFPRAIHKPCRWCGDGKGRGVISVRWTVYSVQCAVCLLLVLVLVR